MNANAQFRQILNSFPPSVQEHLQTIRQSSGMLTGEHCLAVMERLNVSVDDVMVRLLPLSRVV